METCRRSPKYGEAELFICHLPPSSVEGASGNVNFQAFPGIQNGLQSSSPESSLEEAIRRKEIMEAPWK